MASMPQFKRHSRKQQPFPSIPSHSSPPNLKILLFFGRIYCTRIQTSTFIYVSTRQISSVYHCRKGLPLEIAKLFPLLQTASCPSLHLFLSSLIESYLTDLVLPAVCFLFNGSTRPEQGKEREEDQVQFNRTYEQSGIELRDAGRYGI